MIVISRNRLLAHSFSVAFVDSITMSINPRAGGQYLEPGIREKVVTLSIPFNTAPTTAAFRDMIRRLNSKPTHEAINVRFGNDFKRTPHMLSSPSNIPTGQDPDIGAREIAYLP
ncbi:unnamed protein product (mitochondrion) [Plasmodiophora brassicae]|uniref:Uncharacterized protein n=1 Tax=Plasmodiophora brassicae TaxID=37360 RepID=A0A3P3YCK8_PLABS|nr:unnamed protein product [Plasmodiophora brassicae]